MIAKLVPLTHHFDRIISDRPLYRVVPRIGVEGIFLLKTHIVVVNIYDYQKEA